MIFSHIIWDMLSRFFLCWTVWTICARSVTWGSLSTGTMKFIPSLRTLTFTWKKTYIFTLVLASIWPYQSIVNVIIVLYRYPEARAIQRKLIFHAGPTNSGKTYHAIQRYLAAKSGVYCGPLKLLAHEIYEKSNDAVSLSLKPVSFSLKYCCTLEVNVRNKWPNVWLFVRECHVIWWREKKGYLLIQREGNLTTSPVQ